MPVPIAKSIPVAATLAVGLLLGGCLHPGGERGRPETLAPLLGARAGAGAPETKPSEPVEDYWVDLGPLLPAWPEVRTELPRLVQSTIARGSWVDEHHAATILDEAMKVRHRPPVVAQARRLVENLRAQLLIPIALHVLFGDLTLSAATRVMGAAGRDGVELAWSSEEFQSAVARGDARMVARAVLSAPNGRWATSERMCSQSFVTGVSVEGGGITPAMTPLAAGSTIQGATWRWGENRAVVSVTALLTGAAEGGTSVSQKVHRELPQKTRNEHQYESYDLKLELPTRDLVEFQGQLTVARGRWTVAARFPRGKDRVAVVVVKADWATPLPLPESVDPLSGQGFVLDMIPVALPADVRPEREVQGDLENRQDVAANSAGWLKSRAKVMQESQKKNTYNFQNESGTADLLLAPQAAQKSMPSSSYQSRGGAEDGPSGVMPEELERLRDEVLHGEWPDRTALEFVANHVFVVNTRAMAARVRALLEKLHDWRNRRVAVGVAFPSLGPTTADLLGSPTLSAERATALRRASPLLPEAVLIGRGGAWGQIFVGEMHTALSAAWAANRSSPPIHVFWKGARLSVLPHLSASRTQQLNLRFKQHRLEGEGPTMAGGAVLQRPVDSLWSYESSLRIPEGASALVGLHGEGSLISALLVYSRSY
jgi:hypothetical protein